MAGLNTQVAPAIVILGQGSLATARCLQQVYAQATIHGLQGRVQGADQDTTPLAICCAAFTSAVRRSLPCALRVS